MTREFEPRRNTETEADRLFSKWKGAIGLPAAFPNPVPPSLPNANQLISNTKMAFSYLVDSRPVNPNGFGSIQEAVERGRHYTGYSFMILPTGQGTSIFAESTDVANAIAYSTFRQQVPVLIKSDLLGFAETTTNDELRNRVSEEILKRAILAQSSETVTLGPDSPSLTVTKAKFRENNILNGEYEINLEIAKKVLGETEGILGGMDEYFRGFLVGIDFSSAQAKADPVKYGMQVARVFNAVNDVIKNLIDSGQIKEGLIQGFGPTEAFDAIREVSDVDFGIGDQGSISVFDAWRILLGSYPERRDDIGRYIHSGLLGKAVASGEELPIDEIFRRFEENLKEELLKDPNSLHLGFK